MCLWTLGAQCTCLFYPNLGLDLANTSFWAGSACWTVGKLSHLLPWQALSMNKRLSWSPAAAWSSCLVQGKHQGHTTWSGGWRDVCGFDWLKSIWQIKSNYFQNDSPAYGSWICITQSMDWAEINWPHLLKGALLSAWQAQAQEGTADSTSQTTYRPSYSSIFVKYKKNWISFHLNR